MALTNELLRANTALEGLTDEQVAAIVEMSANDEASVIGSKVSEIYNGLDADILASSGIAKQGSEKTYDYAKRAIGELKGKIEPLATQVSDLTKEKARLEAEVAKGGDAETRRALTKAQADLANVTKEYADLKTKFDTAQADFDKRMLDYQIDAEITASTAGLKFKADYPKTVADVLLQQAIAKVKGMNPEYIDDGKGGKVLAFLENGTPKRNPNNNLNPYTAGELVAEQLSAMGVLEAKRTQTGTGTQQTQPKGGDGVVDLSGVQSQAEASDVVKTALLAQGLTVGSPAYQKKYDEVWRENLETIKKLPMRK